MPENKMKRVDTNGILERCECGARCCYLIGDGGMVVGLRCDDNCGEGFIGDDRIDLMVEWNLRIRGLRKQQTGE